VLVVLAPVRAYRRVLIYSAGAPLLLLLRGLRYEREVPDGYEHLEGVVPVDPS
jgi:hypothetical protein